HRQGHNPLPRRAHRQGVRQRDRVLPAADQGREGQGGDGLRAHLRWPRAERDLERHRPPWRLRRLVPHPLSSGRKSGVKRSRRGVRRRGVRRQEVLSPHSPSPYSSLSSEGRCIIMIRRTFTAAAVVLLALAGRGASQTKYTVKVEDAPPPNEL